MTAGVHEIGDAGAEPAKEMTLDELALQMAEQHKSDPVAVMRERFEKLKDRVKDCFTISDYTHQKMAERGQRTLDHLAKPSTRKKVSDVITKTVRGTRYVTRFVPNIIFAGAALYALGNFAYDRTAQDRFTASVSRKNVAAARQVVRDTAVHGGRTEEQMLFHSLEEDLPEKVSLDYLAQTRPGKATAQFTFKKHDTNGVPSTGFARITADDCAEFDAIVAGRVFYAFGPENIGIDAPAIVGNMTEVPGLRGTKLIAHTGGSIYEFTVEAKEEKGHSISMRGLRHEDSTISDIVAHDTTGDGIPEYIYTTGEGELVIIDKEGETLWRTKPAGKPPVVFPPVLLDADPKIPGPELVYAASENSIGVANPELLKSKILTPGVKLVGAPFLDSRTKEILIPAENGIYSLSIGKAPPYRGAVAEGAIYPLDDGMMVIDDEDATFYLKPDMPRWSFSNGHKVRSILNEHKLTMDPYFAHTRAGPVVILGSEERELYILEGRNGDVRRKLDLKRRPYSAKYNPATHEMLLATDGAIYSFGTGWLESKRP